jgi:hypothetical protein
MKGETKCSRKGPVTGIKEKKNKKLGTMDRTCRNSGIDFMVRKPK